MKQHHHWSVEEIENIMPWEREVYVSLLTAYIKEEDEKMKARRNGR